MTRQNKVLFTISITVALLSYVFWPKKPPPDMYYFQIKNLSMRIAPKFAPWEFSDKQLRQRAAEPPGLATNTMFFREQDVHSFVRFSAISTDTIWFNLENLTRTLNRFDYPRSLSSLSWDKPQRDSKNDIHGLKAYRSIDFRDDKLNYRYDFDDGTVLYMSCAHFTMPYPHCFITTEWRGLQLRYSQKFSDLSTWRDLHTRLTKHLDSFIYTP